MKGWVYVISNKAMPGLVKVGFSTKDPELRALELNNTGAPHPYIVDYEALVDQPYTVEQKAHKKLSDKREGKEWFRVTAAEAVVAIKAVVGNGIQLENYKHVDRAQAEKVLSQRRKIDNNRIIEQEREKQRAIDREEITKTRQRSEKYRTDLLKELNSKQKQLQELPKVNARLKWMRYAWFIGMGLFGLVSGGVVGALWGLGITFACWLWLRGEMGKPITETELLSDIEKIQNRLARAGQQ